MDRQQDSRCEDGHACYVTGTIEEFLPEADGRGAVRLAVVETDLDGVEPGAAILVRMDGRSPLCRIEDLPLGYRDPLWSDVDPVPIGGRMIFTECGPAWDGVVVAGSFDAGDIARPVHGSGLCR